MRSNSDSSTFGQRLTAAREALSMSQEELGERLALSKQAINAWEKDRNQPNVAAMLKICQQTGRDANYFILGTEPLLSGDGISVALAFDKLAPDQQDLVRRMLGLPPSMSPRSSASKGGRKGGDKVGTLVKRLA